MLPMAFFKFWELPTTIGEPSSAPALTDYRNRWNFKGLRLWSQRCREWIKTLQPEVMLGDSCRRFHEEGMEEARESARAAISIVVMAWL